MPDAVAYVDGFNLYNGLKDAGLQRFYWLDLRRLAQKIVAPMGFDIGLVRYFTSRVADTNPTQAHQKLWLEAVQAGQPLVQCEWGNFRERRCGLCPAGMNFYTEKGSDVNLAVYVIADYFEGVKNRLGPGRVRPAAQIIFSGDSDQVPTIAAIKRHKSDYPLVVAFPPRRASAEMQSAAGKARTVQITEEMLDGCCMPDVINPYVQKPAEWS